jgi:hypothetical protein
VPPTAWRFGFQHFPNITPAGTLLLSSHMPGFEDTSHPVANQHAFLEFEIDREQRPMIEKWRYTEGPDGPTPRAWRFGWPTATRCGNYGTGGTIREITPTSARRSTSNLTRPTR